MSIIYFLGITLFIMTVGDLGLHILRAKNVPARKTISFALGFVITSYILRLFFSLGIVEANIFTVVICLSIVLNIKRLSVFLKDILKNSSKVFKKKGGFEKTVICILLAQVGFNFFICFTPATAWDGLSFHLAIPKLIKEQGSMVDLNRYAATRHPLLVQMLFTLDLLLKGDHLVHLLSWLTGLLLIIGIYLLSKMLSLGGIDSGKIGLVGAAIFYSTQVVSMWTSTSYIDIYLAFFLVVSLIVILSYFKTRATGMLLLSFILISVLPGIKEGGVFLALIMGIFLVIDLFRFMRGKLLRVSILALIFSIIFTGANLPWYYQFKQDTSREDSILIAMDPVSILSLKTIIASYRWKLYLAFWKLTVDYERDGRIGPLFLTFIPLLFLIKKRHPVNLLLIISLAYIGIFCFFKILLSRYILPIMPFLGLISAYVVYQLLYLNYRIFRLVKLFLIFSFGFNLGLNIYNHLFEIDYLFGKIERDNYIAEKVSCFRLMDYINKNVKKGRVLLIGETRSYYLDRDFLFVGKFCGVPREYILEKLRNEQVTHILVSNYIIYRYRYARQIDIKAQEILDEIKDISEPVYKKGNFSVYRLLI